MGLDPTTDTLRVTRTTQYVSNSMSRHVNWVVYLFVFVLCTILCTIFCAVGGRREVKMNEKFFLGYRKTALTKDEIVVNILLPFTAKVLCVIITELRHYNF